MSKQFNSKYLNDCVEHALERCQQVTPVQADVIRLVRWAFDHSHETNPGVCLDLRKQYEKRVLKLRGLKLRGLKSWERSLVVAARCLLMPQPAMKMNRVLSQCKLALDELDARFYSTYQVAISETSNPDWRFNYSWICQERDWQREHLLKVPPYAEIA
jgi:hypothetical protein